MNWFLNLRNRFHCWQTKHNLTGVAYNSVDWFTWEGILYGRCLNCNKWIEYRFDLLKRINGEKINDLERN